MARKEKKQQKLKARDSFTSPPRGGATADTIPIKLGMAGEPRDAITLAKF